MKQNSDNINYKSDEILLETMRKKSDQNKQIKSSTFYDSNKNKSRNIFLSQSNLSSSEYIKTKYNNFQNYGSSINKNVIFRNKYSPG